MTEHLHIDVTLTRSTPWGLVLPQTLRLCLYDHESSESSALRACAVQAAFSARNGETRWAKQVGHLVIAGGRN